MPKPLKICATCGSEYEHDTLFCPEDGTPLGNSRTAPGQDPYVGLVLGDQVELRQLIGIGSMGRVYRAFQRGVERHVAVKILHRELSSNPTLVARFLREARISSRLSHPNVVQVLMAGQLPYQVGASPIGGELYIVMEYLDGISLLSALAACMGAMPLPRALHIALQICDAVGEAHAQGIVHRDVKPENVMLVRRGDDPDFIKVLDFGIARLDWAEESLATQAGLIFGTARYISPEGSQGEAVTPAADVYAIATILYQCLSGRTPFDANSSVALLMLHAFEPPPSLLSLERANYVPPSLAAVIMRNLAKSPTDRAQDARRFGRELVEAARAGGISADDLVPRSTLLGQRSTHTTFTSLQRTKPLELSAQTAAIIGATEPAAGLSETMDSPEALSEGFDSKDNPVAASESTFQPTSSVDSSSPSIDSYKDTLPVRRYRSRVLAFLLVCVIGGTFLALVGAQRFGLFATSQDSYVERANRALSNQRWDEPLGDNVKDITDEGLIKNPNDRALREVRRKAADELVNAALGRKYSGDILGALRFGRLAVELASDNATAQHLVRELEAMRGEDRVQVLPADSSEPFVDAPNRMHKKIVPPHPIVAPSHSEVSKTTPSSSASSPSDASSSSPAVSSSAASPAVSSSAPSAPSTGGRWL